MSFLDYWYEWISSNLWQIVFSIVVVFVVYIVYKLFSRQITKLKEEQKLEENIAFGLKRIFQWLAGLIVLVIVIAQFGIQIGAIAGLLALAGGTIVGFAAMNTIGNALAGIIVMTSKPFRIGDIILFNGQFADVEAIDLIYTRMKTLDNVLVSVPNQELLQSQIENYGKKTIIRRSCSITPSYDEKVKNIEEVLLEAAETVEGVLENPKPYVWLTDFQTFAPEYTLYIFINEIPRLQEIEANLRRAILETCKRHKIDLSTPSLIRRVENK